MLNTITAIALPANEPVLEYRPGSPERVELTAELERQQGGQAEIPLVIGDREVRTGRTAAAVVPHRHRHVLATVHLAGEAEIDAAIEAARGARASWAAMSYESRAAIFLKAADLLAGPWRQRINAATMLNQSKTCHQAEIDAACETIDFFRFNGASMTEIYASLQPPISPPGTRNTMECRPLEGFVYAVTPFNFLSIAANLPHAPALMGNTVIWKPSPSSPYSNYLVMELLREAGLPPGVINFLPGDAEAVTARLVADRDFAGLHFTGSTTVFRSLWQQIGQNLSRLRSYPRIVGETGGKDFIVAHPSADPVALQVAMVRGAYEYQGQKCSAASRAYVPRSLWNAIKDDLVARIEALPMGDTEDFANFMGAVIHQRSFDKCRHYVDQARASADVDVLAGGQLDDGEGYYVRPTLLETRDPRSPSMTEEIFGPILTVFVYEDGDFEAALDLCDDTSPYGLTGAIFARERAVVDRALDRLRYAAGNFYINDKPTGAVVGQQPFGGARASGTNDKAGSGLNLLRWISPRTIKETYVAPRQVGYPYMESE
jgi:1-pyrroline-5-carboxylate dehydrogenase